MRLLKKKAPGFHAVDAVFVIPAEWCGILCVCLFISIDQAAVGLAALFGKKKENKGLFSK